MVYQVRNVNGIYYDENQLAVTTKKVFGPFLPGSHIHAYPFELNPVDKVAPAWINQRIIEKRIDLWK